MRNECVARREPTHYLLLMAMNNRTHLQNEARCPTPIDHTPEAPITLSSLKKADVRKYIPKSEESYESAIVGPSTDPKIISRL